MANHMTTQVEDASGLSFKIVDEDSVQRFIKSAAYNELIDFITQLNNSVVAVEMHPLEHFYAAGDRGEGVATPSDKVENVLIISRNVQNVLTLIKSMNKYIELCPPIKQPTRFGNKGFQHFCDEYYKEVDNKLPHILSESGLDNVSEHTLQLGHYLKNSIGNRKRIDYGTGHELNFLLFLFCLNKLHFFGPPDYKHLVLVLYRQYLECVRRIQITYTVEPAGSRGAWGLDDFQFLVFLFGAAQLSYNTHIKTDDVRRGGGMYSATWETLFPWCELLFVSLYVPTSQLARVVAARVCTEKICSGLLKMYQAEIIQKRQILQHILFGKLIDF
ncbi:hypothetical protein AK88_04195 [Plasmodium fragile]|uniref:Serine/threonine-protein phosphatase 2A activator n=1 Tax=Plasmodium fragile TaxID=5857 RepID=A0A0D9QGL8_PLAFR|nr:uncharacterized protein AK88_04195 [Plasmodium fragile]KJP86144.1 hypothetical protein AK88_04195 [Plasmodium fragile]